jgi:L,D-peptidoglycan transpeptidase YkuD (ErfK/YbiS/YcfS/YnhG family)
LSIGGLTFEAAIGKGGISALKREGDGATPLASMEIVAGYWRAGRQPRPRTTLAMQPIRHDGGWCDAPWHGRYNRAVRLPFPASAEAMARADHLYDIVLVLDWNYRRRTAGRGSAIFMHLARPGYLPTEGCLALGRRDMLRILERLGAGARVRVVR